MPVSCARLSTVTVAVGAASQRLLLSASRQISRLLRLNASVPRGVAIPVRIWLGETVKSKISLDRLVSVNAVIAPVWLAETLVVPTGVRSIIVNRILRSTSNVLLAAGGGAWTTPLTSNVTLATLVTSVPAVVVDCAIAGAEAAAIAAIATEVPRSLSLLVIALFLLTFKLNCQRTAAIRAACGHLTTPRKITLPSDPTGKD